MLFRLGKQLVGFIRRGDEWFLAINVRPCTQRRQRDRMMLVRLPHRDADEVWTFLFQHLTVIRVAARCANVRRDFGAAFGIRIGQRNNFDIRSVAENAFQSVPVIALTGVADHGALPFGARFGGEAGEVGGDNYPGQ